MHSPSRQHEDDQSDDALVARIALGDNEALRLLMRRYNQKLYRTARSILKDDVAAEDAVQDAYLRAYQAMPGFRGDSRLSTWLVRIVANEALGTLRKSARRAEVILLTEGAPGLSPAVQDGDGSGESLDDFEPLEAMVFRDQVRRLIEAKVDRLPDAFRAVFVLRAVEEMTVEETAECLGIPPATVRTRFFRARGLLRELLEREVDLGMKSIFGFAGERCDRIVAGVQARLQGERWQLAHPHGRYVTRTGGQRFLRPR